MIADKLTAIAENTPKVYNKGYEDGKNSVVDLGKLCNQIHFKDLNVFGKSEVVLELDNVISLNAFYTIINGGVANTTVEKLTINCKKPITDMYKAFNGEVGYKDAKLKTLVLNIDTSQNDNLTNGFLGMAALERIEGTPLDFTSCKGLNQPFRNCSALKELRVAKETIKINFVIDYSPNLSTKTIQSIIDGLATVETQQTLTLHSDVKAKLTETQLSQISSKNWVLA